MYHPLASYPAGHSARLQRLGCTFKKRNLIFREVVYYYCLLTTPLNIRKCEVRAIPSALKLQEGEVGPGA